jgi:hypothetical protein
MVSRRGTHTRKGDASVSAFAPEENDIDRDLTTFNDLGWKKPFVPATNFVLSIYGPHELLRTVKGR